MKKFNMRVMFFASIIVILYNLYLIVDYLVTLKYTVNNGFGNTDIIYSKINRESEMYNLIFYFFVMTLYALITFISIVNISKNQK